jgi:type IV pilus assembly protein PilW
MKSEIDIGVTFAESCHRFTVSSKSRGFTLVELMVAVTLSLIILVAVAQLFATSRSTYGLEENLARVQENGRFAMGFLTEDIRMAGYSGCNSKLTQGTPSGGTCPSGTVCTIVDLNTVTADTAVNFNPDGIKAHKYTGTTGTTLTDWTPALPADYFSNGEVVAGTDVIIIQRASALDTHLTGNTTPSNANIQILQTASIASLISAGDILMVSDCKSADVFKATNASSGSGKITIAHSSAGNTSTTLTHSYGNDAQLMTILGRAYYIGRRNNSASNPPALFRKELVNGGGLQTQELVEGVENMRFLYGEDTDAAPSDNVANIYRAPGSVANWRKVIDVRVGLLVRTLNNVQDTDTKTYTVAGATLGPFNDNLRRRIFSSTIRVRNH